MAAIKKYNGSTWETTTARKYETATETIQSGDTIYADGTAATIGLKGNTVQSGTPSPSNPVDVNGTGERTENLYNINAHDVNNGYVNDAQLSQDGTTETWGSAEISEYIPISGDTAYTFNGIGSYNSPCYGLYDENKQLIGAYRYNGRSTINFTSPNNARYFRFTHLKTATQAMTVEGTYISSTMPEFEPYGFKIPISSNSTTYNKYLGEEQTVRQIKKLVLTGEENWKYSTSSQVHWIENVPNDYDNTLFAQITTVCTHYKCIQNNTGLTGMANGDLRLYAKATSPIAHELYIKDETYTSAADFKSYLQQQYANGTPVCVWYVLATPTTGITNEPLMKIGTYTDSISGISLPTTDGANTITVDTTVQPSEFTATWTGWHNASVKEYDGSQWNE